MWLIDKFFTNKKTKKRPDLFAETSERDYKSQIDALQKTGLTIAESIKKLSFFQQIPIHSVINDLCSEKKGCEFIFCDSSRIEYDKFTNIVKIIDDEEITLIKKEQTNIQITDIKETITTEIKLSSENEPPKITLDEKIEKETIQEPISKKDNNENNHEKVKKESSIKKFKLTT